MVDLVMGGGNNVIKVNLVLKRATTQLEVLTAIWFFSYHHPWCLINRFIMLSKILISWFLGKGVGGFKLVRKRAMFEFKDYNFIVQSLFYKMSYWVFHSYACPKGYLANENLKLTLILLIWAHFFALRITMRANKMVKNDFGNLLGR